MNTTSSRDRDRVATTPSFGSRCRKKSLVAWRIIIAESMLRPTQAQQKNLGYIYKDSVVIYTRYIYFQVADVLAMIDHKPMLYSLLLLPPCMIFNNAMTFLVAVNARRLEESATI